MVREDILRLRREGISSFYNAGKVSELTCIIKMISGQDRTAAERKMSQKRPAAGGESG